MEKFREVDIGRRQFAKSQGELFASVSWFSYIQVRKTKPVLTIKVEVEKL